jgi:hypothetical protein
MFDQLSAEIPASLIKGFPTTTRTTTRTTTKQNVDPAVHFVYSPVKNIKWEEQWHTGQIIDISKYPKMSNFKYLKRVIILAIFVIGIFSKTVQVHFWCLSLMSIFCH